MGRLNYAIKHFITVLKNEDFRNDCFVLKLMSEASYETYCDAENVGHDCVFYFVSGNN